MLFLLMFGNAWWHTCYPCFFALEEEFVRIALEFADEEEPT